MAEENSKAGALASVAKVVVGILIGLPLGCLVSLIIIGISLQSKAVPRELNFGDVSIRIMTPEDANELVAEELLMKKRNRAFLYALKNDANEVTNVALVNGAERLILTFVASGDSGEWMFANYGRSVDGVLVGEAYRDIGFDGQFDIRLTYDEKGQLCSRDIFHDTNWTRVDHLTGRKAASGPNEFTFRMGSGWELDTPVDN